MASTNSTVSGTVTFETDDDLSETNIGAADAQGNRVDYVERGCGFSVNHTNETIDIGSTGTRANYAIVENPSSHVAWHLYPDQDTDIALPNASATNHVFIAYDESTDAISYHIDDDDTAPSEPSLKIGTVDTANDTPTETNRNPDGTFETTTTDEIITTPTGAIVSLSGNQSVADASATVVAWDTETSRGAVSNILSTSSPANAVVVPAGYSWARCTIGIAVSAETTMEVLAILKNGSNVLGGGYNTGADVYDTSQGIGVTTAWIPVSENDEIKTNFRHNTPGGGAVDVVAGNASYMEVHLT